MHRTSRCYRVLQHSEMQCHASVVCKFVTEKNEVRVMPGASQVTATVKTKTVVAFEDAVFVHLK